MLISPRLEAAEIPVIQLCVRLDPAQWTIAGTLEINHRTCCQHRVPEQQQKKDISVPGQLNVHMQNNEPKFFIQLFTKFNLNWATHLNVRTKIMKPWRKCQPLCLLYLVIGRTWCRQRDRCNSNHRNRYHVCGHVDKDTVRRWWKGLLMK